MKKPFLLLAIVMMTHGMYAAIHYTQVFEQVTSSSPRYYDVDLDGDNDFYFTAVDIGPSTGSVNFYVNNSKVTSYYAAEGATDTLPKAYAEGASLGTYHWRGSKGLLGSLTIGNFNNSTKYLVVKFSDGTNTYNGWFLISKSGWTMDIESFAYSDVPNEMIKAGETDVVAEFSWDNDAGGNVTFNNTTIGIDPLNYHWDFGDGATSTDQFPDHEYTANGSYTVCLIADNTLRSDTFCATVQVTKLTVGIAPSVNPMIRFSPNPVSNVIQIETGDWKLNKVQVMDLTGKVLLANPQPSFGKTVLDTGSLPPGTYICQLTGADGKVAAGRIVKE